MSEETATSQFTPQSLIFNQALWRRRSIKDLIARYLVSAGGFAVIGSIVLIFVFLFSVVFPLFKGAKLHEVTSYPLNNTGTDNTLLYSIEEQAEIAMRLNDKGVVDFFNVDTGDLIEKIDLLANSNATVSS